MPTAQSSLDSRRAPREAIDCPSRFWFAALPPADALIVNVSPHGCMVRSDSSVPIGARVTVDVPGVGDLRGQVIWALGARFGVEFEETIELEPYLGMLAMLKSAPEQS